MLRRGAGLTPVDAAETFKRATAAAVRALSGCPDVPVAFGEADGDGVCLPEPSASLTRDEVARVRGAADAAALRLKHHDPAIHSRYRPAAPGAGAAFDAMEQARVEILGARRHRGVALNIARALELRAGEASPLQVLIHARAGTVPSRPVYAAPDALIDDLLQQVHDQRAFAELARRIACALGLDHAESPSAQAPSPDEASVAIESGAGAAGADEMPEGELPIPQGAVDPGAAPGQAGGALFPGGDAGPRYRIFTTKFDRTVHARDLCTAEERARLRAALDRELRGLQVLVSRLAKRLERRLMTRQRRAWEFNLDEGAIDAGRLARVVVNPRRPLAFKQMSASPVRDTAVSLLVDNSGSMQGRPITVAALAAEVLARTLERCGVSVEILGFTTADWKGGEARRLWERSGRPQNPGRVNDLRHIVYKAAAVPWRRARANLGAMISGELLRENIDGEALAWAHRRLRRRHEQRRILLVVSDGAPADESTLSLNPADYLDRHLREVVARMEHHRAVELIAIGIGHDVKRYYRNAVTINDVEELGGAVLREVASLFEVRPFAFHGSP